MDIKELVKKKMAEVKEKSGDKAKVEVSDIESVGTKSKSGLK